MTKVTLVGTGKVSSHLEEVFKKAERVDLIEVLSSRKNDIEDRILDNSDIYIIAVSDDAISSVSEQFKKTNKLIVHTSGSVSLNALPDEVKRGVFYPLQTFSRGRKVDFKTIPICIEAEKKEDLELLHRLASSVSESVYEITSEQRKSLHLGAVFVNNFTNHIYQIGSEICEENEVPFNILKPLIKETVEKINSFSPLDAQTGPAIRNDKETIRRHLKQLENKTHQEVYKILTKSIQETYGEKL